MVQFKKLVEGEDLHAVCEFISHLGPGGEAGPGHLQPDK
jgi:hypothetical protein